jgi:hypothetical protein
MQLTGNADVVLAVPRHRRPQKKCCDREGVVRRSDSEVAAAVQWAYSSRNSLGLHARICNDGSVRPFDVACNLSDTPALLHCLDMAAFH